MSIYAGPERAQKNINGCGFLCFYHLKGVTWQCFATLKGLRAFLVEHADCDDPASLETEMLWAETTPPGVTRAFFSVMWIISIDPREDHEGNIEFQDYDEGIALGMQLGPADFRPDLSRDAPWTCQCGNGYRFARELRDHQQRMRHLSAARP